MGVEFIKATAHRSTVYRVLHQLQRRDRDTSPEVSKSAVNNKKSDRDDDEEESPGGVFLGPVAGSAATSAAAGHQGFDDAVVVVGVIDLRG